jgi:hypothetical protein
LATLEAGDRIDTECGNFPDPLPAQVDKGANDNQYQGPGALGNLAGEH